VEQQGKDLWFGQRRSLVISKASEMQRLNCSSVVLVFLPIGYPTARSIADHKE